MSRSVVERAGVLVVALTVGYLVYGTVYEYLSFYGPRMWDRHDGIGHSFIHHNYIGHNYLSMTIGYVVYGTV